MNINLAFGILLAVIPFATAGIMFPLFCLADYFGLIKEV